VSNSAEAARRMLEWFLASHPDRPVFWDVLPDNVAADRLAAEYGFEMRRRLTRMGRRIKPGVAPIQTDSSLVFAIAGFEFG